MMVWRTNLFSKSFYILVFTSCFKGFFTKICLGRQFCPSPGPPRGVGRGGQWPRGPWTREGAHPNDIEKWKAHQSRMQTAWFRPEKPLKFRRRPFFGGGGDHIIFWTNQQHFLGVFWTLQNHNSVTFELAPGPRSALGAPAPDFV